MSLKSGREGEHFFFIPGKNAFSVKFLFQLLLYTTTPLIRPQLGGVIGLVPTAQSYAPINVKLLGWGGGAARHRWGI